MEKPPNEAFAFIESLAENARAWDIPGSSGKQGPTNAPLGGGKYILKEQDDLHLKVAQLTRKLEAIELKKVNEVSSVP